jgi:hypothetical protein
MANQVSKLNYVDAKLGAPTSGQQTTRYIYDSVTPGVGGTNVTFFQNFAGKNQFQTNLTTNKLDSMESMVIKSIFLAVAGGNPGGTLNFSGHLNLNIYVGNQCVLKDFDPSFNSTNRGLAFDRLHSGVNNSQLVEVRLLTDIIIPPQVNFKATLEFAENTALGDTSVTLGLKGYGKIFSAGMSF